MAHGKRASMREGPLAELFRKTTQDDTDEQAAPPTREEAREPVAQERLTPPSPPSSLRRDDDEPHIPTAKERLSAAFSHDIPHDVLERPGREYRPRDEPRTAP